MQMDSMATDSFAGHMCFDQLPVICLACLEDFRICNPYNSNGHIAWAISPAVQQHIYTYF